MPLYEYRCNICGCREEHIVAQAKREETVISCTCGTRMQRLVSPVTTVGIVFSNALDIPSAGVRFESNAQRRAWETANPDKEILPSGDSRFNRQYDRVRDLAETRAQARGHAGFKEYQESARKRVKRQQELGEYKPGLRPDQK